MKKSELTITRKEEVDYDNKRLVYVMDISRLETHNWEEKINLSTDDVVSLFDGGYQLGLIEQIQLNEKSSEVYIKTMKKSILSLQDELIKNGVNLNKINKIIHSIDETIENHETQIKTNLIRNFEISKFSNETRVRDKKVKRRMYEFHDHLDRIYKD